MIACCTSQTNRPVVKASQLQEMSSRSFRKTWYPQSCLRFDVHWSVTQKALRWTVVAPHGSPHLARCLISGLLRFQRTEVPNELSQLNKQRSTFWERMSLINKLLLECLNFDLGNASPNWKSSSKVLYWVVDLEATQSIACFPSAFLHIGVESSITQQVYMKDLRVTNCVEGRSTNPPLGVEDRRTSYKMGVVDAVGPRSKLNCTRKPRDGELLSADQQLPTSSTFGTLQIWLKTVIECVSR
jgi:hypothetical protein